MPTWEPPACKKYKELLETNKDKIQEKLREAKERKDAGDSAGLKRKLQLVVQFKKFLWNQAIKTKGGRRRTRRRTRRRRRRKRRRRKSRRGSGKAPKQRDRLKKARDWEGRKKTARGKIKKQKMKDAMGRMIGPRAPHAVAAPAAVNPWAAAAAAQAAEAAVVQDLGGAFGGLQVAPTAAQQQAAEAQALAALAALSTKGGRRRTRRRRGGMNPPNPKADAASPKTPDARQTVGNKEAAKEEELKRRQKMMIEQEKQAREIKKKGGGRRRTRRGGMVRNVRGLNSHSMNDARARRARAMGEHDARPPLATARRRAADRQRDRAAELFRTKGKAKPPPRDALGDRRWENHFRPCIARCMDDAKLSPVSRNDIERELYEIGRHPGRAREEI